jgi:hypothetical protein
MERFWKKVTFEPNSGCWLWTASLSKAGYGQFVLEGIPLKAHRFSYEMLVGEIPRGSIILHKCDNPACVNPAHLRPGSYKDNVQDSIAKGRSSCKRGHKFTEENTHVDKSGVRRCLTCMRERSNRHREENREKHRGYWRKYVKKKREQRIADDFTRGIRREKVEA